MKRSGAIRFYTALVALFSVLFTQLAVAAYACPVMQLEQAMQAAAVASAGIDHRQMHDCEAADGEQSAQCHAHAQLGNQSLAKPVPPDVSPSAAILLVPATSGIRLEYAPLATHADAPWLRRASAPPLSIRNCCFRI